MQLYLDRPGVVFNVAYNVDLYVEFDSLIINNTSVRQIIFVHILLFYYIHIFVILSEKFKSSINLM